MALENTDLLVVQDSGDKKLYKLRVDKLSEHIKLEIEAGAGVNFRGDVNLNVAPGVGDNPSAPFANGDLYLVDSNATVIASGWTMSEGETSATQGDRIIYDGADNNWILISSGSTNAGTVTDVKATYPVLSDGDAKEPVISAALARTTKQATDSGDGLGTAGTVARLADNDDVAHTSGTADATAVVTADLLKATNDIVQGLSVAAGGVTTVTYANSDSNNAILIPDTSGNVTLDIKNATATVSGVVQIADASDITAGTSGANAVVDASQLKVVNDRFPATILTAISEGGSDTVSGALKISTDGSGVVTIGVNEEVFAPFNFSALTDIND